MTGLRRTAVVVGVLFWISNLATLIGSVISGQVPSAQDSLTTMYPHRTELIVGALVSHINDAAIIGYAVVLFPVLKRYSESLALGYVAFKVAEAILLAVGAVALLSLIGLSERYLTGGSPDSGYFQSTAQVTLDQQFLASRMAAISYIVATPILNYVLFQTRLVPRFISVWGLVAVLLLATGLALRIPDPTHGFQPGHLLLIPIILWELFFATWLIARGFSSSTVEALSAA